MVLCGKRTTGYRPAGLKKSQPCCMCVADNCRSSASAASGPASKQKALLSRGCPVGNLQTSHADISAVMFPEQARITAASEREQGS